MRKGYRSMQVPAGFSRREFVKSLGAASAVTAGGLVLAGPGFGQAPPAAVETNVADFMKVPRTPRSLPGLCPGRVVKVTDKRSLVKERFDGKVIDEMFRKGLTALTGKNPKESFRLLIDPKDVVGIKVNPNFLEPGVWAQISEKKGREGLIYPGWSGNHHDLASSQHLLR